MDINIIKKIYRITRYCFIVAYEPFIAHLYDRSTDAKNLFLYTMVMGFGLISHWLDLIGFGFMVQYLITVGTMTILCNPIQVVNVLELLSIMVMYIPFTVLCFIRLFLGQVMVLSQLYRIGYAINGAVYPILYVEINDRVNSYRRGWCDRDESDFRTHLVTTQSFDYPRLCFRILILGPTVIGYVLIGTLNIITSILFGTIITDPTHVGYINQLEQRIFYNDMYHGVLSERVKESVKIFTEDLWTHCTMRFIYPIHLFFSNIYKVPSRGLAEIVQRVGIHWIDAANRRRIRIENWYQQKVRQFNDYFGYYPIHDENQKNDSYSHYSVPGYRWSGYYRGALN